ncbi:MAG: hypothetical protein IJ008_01880 [Clostridia bacterium]|nr:hypothetical protein [Clostridia bacterium]
MEERQKKLEGMTLAVFALIFAFLVPLITYICGGIGLHKANIQIAKDNKTPTTVKTMCISSMILTTVLLVLTVCAKNMV